MISTNTIELVSMMPEAASRFQAAMSATPKPIGTKAAKPELGETAIGTFDGIITPQSNAMLRDWMERARTNDSVTEAVLQLRSPGGSVEGTAETFEIGHRLAMTKPFTVLASGYLCSAAYHIAAPASNIYASPSCIVGSCGVIAVLVDDSKMFEAMGVRVIPVTTGDAKSVGLPGVPVTEEMVQRTQKRINDMRIAFQRNLRRAGRMTAQQREDAFESADVYLAEDAKKRGFIDKVMIPEDYINKLQSKIRAEYFLDLTGEEADEKFEALACRQSRVSDYYDAEDEDVDKVRSKYPSLSRARDDYRSQLRTRRL